jgi:hypothetical protein
MRPPWVTALTMQGPCRNNVRTVCAHVPDAIPDSSGMSGIDFAGAPVRPSGHPGQLPGCPARCSRARVVHAVASGAHGCCAVARRPCWPSVLRERVFFASCMVVPCCVHYARCVCAALNKAPPCRYARCTRLADCGALPRGLRPLEPPACACAVRATGM